MTHEMTQQSYEDLFELDIKVSSIPQSVETEQGISLTCTKLECSNFITCHCVPQQRDARSPQ